MIYRALIVLLIMAAIGGGFYTAEHYPTAIAGKQTHMFVPEGSFYMNKHWVNTVILLSPDDMPFGTMAECKQKVGQSVLDVREAGKVPEGGDLLGMCVPVPIEMP